MKKYEIFFYNISFRFQKIFLGKALKRKILNEHEV